MRSVHPVSLLFLGPSHHCVGDQSNLSSDRETEGYGGEYQQRTSAGAVGVDVLAEFKSFGARLSGLAKPRIKGSSMRVKKRVKRGVKKGIKSVKSAPPGAYLAGAGVLVGGAAVLLLATTKSGQELLARTAQLALRPEADEQESQESDVQDEAGADEQEPQESDVQDEAEADEQEHQEADVQDEAEADEQEPQESDVQDEAEADEQELQESDVQDEAEADTDGDDESKVAELKPRNQRPRSAAPGRRPRSPRKAPAPAER